MAFSFAYVSGHIIEIQDIRRQQKRANFSIFRLNQIRHPSPKHHENFGM